MRATSHNHHTPSQVDYDDYDHDHDDDVHEHDDHDNHDDHDESDLPRPPWLQPGPHLLLGLFPDNDDCARWG